MESRIIRLNGKAHLETVTVKNSRTEREEELLVAGLFIAVGQEPDNRAFSDAVRLDASGYVEAGEDCRTSRAGIFTAGDCRTKEVRQLATAAADGAVAALAACAYMEQSSWQWNDIACFSVRVLSVVSSDEGKYPAGAGKKHAQKDACSSRQQCGERRPLQALRFLVDGQKSGGAGPVEQGEEEHAYGGHPGPSMGEE